MNARRVEITLDQETWDRFEAQRGHEPRASFVRRALESALSEHRPTMERDGYELAALGTPPEGTLESTLEGERGRQSPPLRPASSRASRHAPSAPGNLPRSALPADHRALALERQAKLNKAKT